MSLDDGSSDEKRFYVYAYLDPRRPGRYEYGDYYFDMEPFYIGKGHGRRSSTMIRGRNAFVRHKVAKILREGFDPVVVKIKRNMSEGKAYDLERALIGLIGRRDKKVGPLTNLSDGGDGSSAGRIVSKEERLLRSRISKREWANPNSKFNSVEYRKLLVESNKKSWADPNSGLNQLARKQKIIAAIKAAKKDPNSYINSDAFKKRCSDRSKEVWSRPQSPLRLCQDARTAGIKKSWQNPQLRERAQHTRRGLWNDPNSGYNQPQRREKIALAHAMWWVVTSPDGASFTVLNLRKFCRENGLDAAAMHRVAISKAKLHKGWKCGRLECQI